MEKRRRKAARRAKRAAAGGQSSDSEDSTSDSEDSTSDGEDSTSDGEHGSEGGADEEDEAEDASKLVQRMQTEEEITQAWGTIFVHKKLKEKDAEEKMLEARRRLWLQEGCVACPCSPVLLQTND